MQSAYEQRHQNPRASENRIVVEVADLKVSNDPESMLITYALGSCIAVIVYDPVKVVGGMIHYMLSMSKISPEKAQAKPAMFADTGVPLLFKTMYGYGCKKEDLIVKVTGGGNLQDENGTFNIGKRNYTILRKLFWKNDIIITSEDVGDSKSRTARLYVDTGRVFVRSQNEEIEL